MAFCQQCNDREATQRFVPVEIETKDGGVIIQKTDLCDPCERSMICPDCQDIDIHVSEPGQICQPCKLERLEPAINAENARRDAA